MTERVVRGAGSRYRRWMPSFTISVLSIAAALAASANPPPKAGGMGKIAFPVTGTAACKAKFIDGMLALHSFEYDDAHAAFVLATKADPRCAMAYWGDAMSYNHPLWGEDELAASRAALARITEEEKLTAKERAFIAAARTLFGEGDFKTRQANWLRAAEKMRADFPGDDEVSLQLALALISNSERLRITKKLMDSAAISMEIFHRRPDHPGAAHYLIHACDTADHAVLALPAARQYAKIAPAAAHARHMPAHIFVLLGMWKESVASNTDSFGASEARVTAEKKKSEDMDWHSYAWLIASYLELGQVKKADSLLRGLLERIQREDGPEKRYALSIAARYFLTQTGRWQEADQWYAPFADRLPLEEGESTTSSGCGLHAPGGGAKPRPPFGLLAGVLAAQGRAEAAMWTGDEKAVVKALEPTKLLFEAMDKWGSMLPPDLRDRSVRTEAALIAGARARKAKTKEAYEAAVAAFQKLGELRPPMPGGPAFIPPASYVAGELLLEAGKPKDALASFEAALVLHPGMSKAMLGAARAAEQLGDETAAERYAALSKQWAEADADFAGAKEAGADRDAAGAARGTH